MSIITNLHLIKSICLICTEYCKFRLSQVEIQGTSSTIKDNYQLSRTTEKFWFKISLFLITHCSSYILLVWANSGIDQYLITYWTFYQPKMVRLSWFHLHWVSLLEPHLNILWGEIIKIVKTNIFQTSF